jgi:hypothetical protein
VREVQVTPSRLVRIVPASPTDTRSPPFPVVTSFKLFPVGRGLTNFQSSPTTADAGDTVKARMQNMNSFVQDRKLNSVLSKIFICPPQKEKNFDNANNPDRIIDGLRIFYHPKRSLKFNIYTLYRGVNGLNWLFFPLGVVGMGSP